jgi:bacteriocin-like protein
MKKSSTRASRDSLARSRELSEEELANVTGGTPSIPIPPPLGDPLQATPSIPIPPPLS